MRSVSQMLAILFSNTGNDYIDGLFAIKYNYATENNIDFNVDSKANLSLLKLPSDELISIFSNLIDNAFDSFDQKVENKKIQIKLFTIDDIFIIECSDNGKQIPLDIKNKIFDKGFTTKTGVGDDHGFGLFITKQIIEKNNGKIVVSSSQIETKFIIEFKNI